MAEKSTSGGQQVVQEKAQQAKEQVQQATGTMQEKVRQQVDTRSTEAGHQVDSIGEAIRKASEHLGGQGNELPAKAAEQAAQKAEQLGRYLREADADQILRDVEDFGRRQPWVMVVAGLAVGVAAARFVKASSRRRYGDSEGYGSAPRAALGGQSYGSSTYGTPAYGSGYEAPTGTAMPPAGGAMTAEETAASRYPTEPIEVTPSPTEQERGIYRPRGSE